MGALNHLLVEDRVIQGEGTNVKSWLETFSQNPLFSLNIESWNAKRIVIVAPHPDDEILGCGGLIQQLAHQNCEIVILAVTNGTLSHPESKKYSSEDLNQLRPQESLMALQSLGVAQQTQHITLNLTDGQVHMQTDQLWQSLNQIIQDEDILICTYSGDGHPDHEAVGRTVEKFSKIKKLTCLQVLIWAWHWASPLDSRIDWQRGRAYLLTDEQLSKKRRAILQFKTQIESDETTGQEAILSSVVIERLLMPYEVYLSESF